MALQPPGLPRARQAVVAPIPRRFLTMLIKAHAQDRLKFFADHSALANKQAFKRLLAPLRKSEWVVYSKNPFAGPEQVLRYLSRISTVSPSPIGVWSPPTTTASPSAGRTTASMDQNAGRR